MRQIDNALEKIMPELLNLESFRFRISEISTMTGVSTRQLRYWEQKGYIHPMTRTDQQKARMYDFHTFVAVRIMKVFLDEGYRLPSAAEKMTSFLADINVFRDFVKQAFRGIEIVDGQPAVDMGSFDKAGKQILYGINDNGHIRYIVKDKKKDQQ
ncbi:MerR family transcriptional regulator [Secundilactobacillus collinoides]|uniref:HTH merR-type domain-containing protein n=3 Tax=Secundilactobacillus collinoides TaxID=33960 RepID=A0A0R2BE43_SECCO|nr:MerR family transcriptional regulator [Secundilactobacillus collinoides]KRM77983.1 hypothetical protein FC82_GL000006 [Secundilactobacillus collinoides DSM 20515 = JCM 1123]